MNARNPKYSRPDNSAIDLEYQHPVFGWIPFTAAETDPEQLGRDLFAAAKAGQFGGVPPYDGPTADELAADSVRCERDRRLAQDVDAVATHPLRWASLSDGQKQAIADYRQALLDVTKQPGFPMNVIWPTKPE